MEIIKGVEIVDLALFFKKQKILVLADVHLGYEEALNKSGVLIPRFQFKDTETRLEKILKVTKPKVVVINGDLKHEFGRISRQEWNDVYKFIDLILKYSPKMIFVKGNHDTVLKAIADKKGVDVVVNYSFDDVIIEHGDALNPLSKEVKTIVIGHEHPAVSLREGGRVEKYKCFLRGKWKGRTLLVLPSFFSLIEGTDILEPDLISPYLKGDLGSYKVFIASKGSYEFGTVKQIKKLNKE